MSSLLEDGLLLMGKRDSRTRKGKVSGAHGLSHLYRSVRGFAPDQAVPDSSPAAIPHPCARVQIFKGSFGKARPKRREINPYSLLPQRHIRIPEQVRPHPMLPPTAAAALA